MGLCADARLLRRSMERQCFDTGRMLMGARARGLMKHEFEASRAAYGLALMAVRTHSMSRTLTLIAPMAIALATERAQ